MRYASARGKCCPFTARTEVEDLIVPSDLALTLQRHTKRVHFNGRQPPPTIAQPTPPAAPPETPAQLPPPSQQLKSKKRAHRIYKHAFTARAWPEVTEWMDLQRLKRAATAVSSSTGRVRHYYYCPSVYAAAGKRSGRGQQRRGRCAYKACVLEKPCSEPASSGGGSGPLEVYTSRAASEHTCGDAPLE